MIKDALRGYRFRKRQLAGNTREASCTAAAVSPMRPSIEFAGSVMPATFPTKAPLADATRADSPVLIGLINNSPVRDRGVGALAASAILNLWRSKGVGVLAGPEGPERRLGA